MYLEGCPQVIMMTNHSYCRLENTSSSPSSEALPVQLSGDTLNNNNNNKKTLWLKCIPSTGNPVQSVPGHPSYTPGAWPPACPLCSSPLWKSAQNISCRSRSTEKGPAGARYSQKSPCWCQGQGPVHPPSAWSTIWSRLHDHTGTLHSLPGTSRSVWPEGHRAIAAHPSARTWE